VRGLANSKRSTAPSNGMDAKSSAGVPLSSPAAAQRCAKGAGLDSGTPAAAQSAMPSIALPATAPTAEHFPPNAAALATPHLQSRISTSLTDVTLVVSGTEISNPVCSREESANYRFRCVGIDASAGVQPDSRISTLPNEPNRNWLRV